MSEGHSHPCCKNQVSPDQTFRLTLRTTDGREVSGGGYTWLQVLGRIESAINSGYLAGASVNPEPSQVHDEAEAPGVMPWKSTSLISMLEKPKTRRKT